MSFLKEVTKREPFLLNLK